MAQSRAYAVAPSQEEEEDPDASVYEAMDFLQCVKMEFRDRPQVYSEFEGILKKFIAQEMCSIGVRDSVSRLFHGNVNMLVGFNSFLPDSHRIDIDAHLGEPQKPAAVETKEDEVDADLQRAAEYVVKVKKIYPSETETFKSFIALLTGCRSGQIALKDGFEQISLLFVDEVELIEDFIYFLPTEIHDFAKDHLESIRTEAFQLTQTKQPDFGICTLCMDRPRSHSFVPCGHLCACGFCAALALVRTGCCPICSEKPERVMRVFLP